MSCLLCGSDNEAKLSAEILFQFRDVNNVAKPGLFAFPEVSICMDCGFSGFAVQQDELQLLAAAIPALESSTVQ